MHFIISFVAPKVFAARNLFSEQIKHREDHVRSYLASYPFKFSQVDVSLISKRHIEDGVHLFQCINSLLKILSTPTFLGESSLANEIGVLYEGHARDYSGDVNLRDELVPIKVVNLEDQVDLLFNRGAVKSEQSLQEFLLV